MDFVYQLAADMGGIGYITASHAGIAHNNSLMNLYMLEASRSNGVERFFVFILRLCLSARAADFRGL